MLIAALPGTSRVVPDLASRVALRATRWGGRCFRVPRPDRPGEEDRAITLPDATGHEAVLVPRGHGWPLVVARTRDGWRALPGGQPCGGGRWEDAGGIAAWVRRVELPSGPVRAVPWEERAPGAHTLAIRLVNVAWAAARRQDPSVGHGAVAVGGLLVRGLSQVARAAGIHEGMTMQRAIRLCPRLRVVAPTRGPSLTDEVAAWLGAAAGPVVRQRGVLLVPWSASTDSAQALARMDSLLRRLWQAFGVEAKAALSVSAAAATVVVRLLDRAEVAVVPVGAEPSWRGSPGRGATTGGARGAWEGPALPDVEGIVRTTTALLDALRPGDCRVRVRTAGATIELTVPAPARGVRMAMVVEPRLRVALARCGPVERIEVLLRPGRVVPAAGRSPQVALLAGMR